MLCKLMAVQKEEVKLHSVLEDALKSYGDKYKKHRGIQHLVSGSGLFLWSPRGSCRVQTGLVQGYGSNRYRSLYRR